jgi:hypothetical protein
MGTVQELQAELRAVTAEQQSLAERSRDIRLQIAALSTPLRVGQRVTYDGAKKVWELTRIEPGYGDGTTPKFHGNVVRKDGTAGVLETHIWQVPYGKSLYPVESK